MMAQTLQYPIILDEVSIQKTTQHPVVVNMEYNLNRREQAIVVSSQVGNRTFARRASVDADFAHEDVMDLTDCLAVMVKRAMCRE
jgi:hypothetical protein